MAGTPLTLGFLRDYFTLDPLHGPGAWRRHAGRAPRQPHERTRVPFSPTSPVGRPRGHEHDLRRGRRDGPADARLRLVAHAARPGQRLAADAADLRAHRPDVAPADVRVVGRRA